MIPLESYLIDEVERIPWIVKEQFKASRNWPRRVGGPGVATGAGDSYAAALFAQFASGGEYVAVDPVHLINALPRWAREVLAFSVKGRTTYVIEAVKALRRAGSVATAITAIASSRLAKESDRVLELAYAGGAHPVGVGNYVAELAAVWAYLGREPSNVRRVVEEVKPVTIPKEWGGEVVAIGEGVGFVNAMFLCLKLYEALCMRCRYFEAEQFLHAPIYSISKDSIIVVLEHPGGVRAGDVVDVLKAAGKDFALIEASEDELATAVKGAAVAALTAAAVAKAEGLSSPCFTSRKELREASTPSIYGR